MSALPPVFQDTGLRRWQNWHEFRYRVKQLLDVWNGDPQASSVEGYNATSKGLQDLIGRAARDGDRVRAAGGGWSYSSVAAPEKGILLNTRPLNYLFPLSSQNLHPEYEGSAANLLLAQCGNLIANLNHFLEPRGQSLQTSGASNGQTIVGAMSTGTHGAAIDVGAVQDYVVALHILVSGDRSVWLERASAPVMQDATAQQFGGAEVIRDDDLFEAALVSFGSFGLIHGALLEVTDLFILQAFRRNLEEVDEGFERALDQLDFSGMDMPRPERPHHFQMLFNPFDEGPSGHYVTTMYKIPQRQPDCQPIPFGRTRAGDGALEVAGVITDIAPALTPQFADFLIKSIYKPYEKVCGTHGEIFTDTAVRGKSASSAMGIPLGQVREALDIVLAAIRAKKVPVLVAARYVKASRATLAFTSHGPQTCVLEVDGPRSRGVRSTYRRIWRDLRSSGIPFTFHWGKMNDLDRDPRHIREMYGSRLDRWLTARRTLLPDPALRRVFANDFLEKAEIDD